MKKTSVLLLVFFIFIVNLGAQNQRGLSAAAAQVTDTTIGRQFAVFIAINRYKDWLPLKSPVNDARKLKDMLTSRYWITDTVELYDEDATKAGILKRFDALVQELKPEDSLFIYYAGHGHLDEVTATGFWIPQDAGTDPYAQQNWIANTQLRGVISRMKSRHVLLVSDSCFSGDILNPSRGAMPAITDEYFRNAYARRSRQVLTSGSSETVPDESTFSRSLLRTLEENTKPLVDPLMLFNEIRLSTYGTTPLFGALSGTDHQEGGAFLLFLKQDTYASASNAALSSGTPGSILLKAGTARLEVRMDGKSIGKTEDNGSGLFKDIPAGEHEFELFGDSLYGSEKVSIAGGKTETVSVKMLNAGSLEVKTSTEISIGVNSPEKYRSFQGSGMLDHLPVASYVVTARAPDGPALTRIVEIKKGKTSSLDLTPATIVIPARIEGLRLSVGGVDVALRLEQGSGNLVSGPIIPDRYSIQILGRFPYYESGTLAPGQRYELTDWKKDALKALSQERKAADRALNARSGKVQAGWISFTVGLLGAGGAGAAWYFANQALTAYNSTTEANALAEARSMVETLRLVVIGSAAVGGLGFGAAPIFFSGPSEAVLQAAVNRLDAEISSFGK